MRLSVGYADNTLFLARGANSFAKIKEALERSGATLSGRVLEWGCGCGRIIRHALAHGLDAHGCDINADAIEWCKENIEADRFIHCGVDPSLPYEDESFDFVYAGSVITHLSLDLQLFWAQELRRILKPGGFMLLTFHGAYHFRHFWGRDTMVVRSINDQPILEVGDHDEGSNNYGVAQTVGALDIVTPGFQRKHHTQNNNILGSQDTAVYQKITVDPPQAYALLKSSLPIDRSTAAMTADGKEVAWINGGMADQLYFLPIDEPASLASKERYTTMHGLELLRIVKV